MRSLRKTNGKTPASLRRLALPAASSLLCTAPVCRLTLLRTFSFPRKGSTVKVTYTGKFGASIADACGFGVNCACFSLKLGPCSMQLALSRELKEQSSTQATTKRSAATLRSSVRSQRCLVSSTDSRHARRIFRQSRLAWES